MSLSNPHIAALGIGRVAGASLEFKYGLPWHRGSVKRLQPSGIAGQFHVAVAGNKPAMGRPFD